MARYYQAPSVRRVGLAASGSPKVALNGFGRAVQSSFLTGCRIVRLKLLGSNLIQPSLARSTKNITRRCKRGRESAGEILDLKRRAVTLNGF